MLCKCGHARIWHKNLYPTMIIKEKYSCTKIKSFVAGKIFTMCGCFKFRRK